MTRARINEAQRWLANVAMTCDDAACLTFPFNRTGNAKGYAKIWHPGSRRMVWAHRRVCELEHGAPPAGKSVARHTCGGGFDGCVNRHHLAWGTSTENADDQKRHGTWNPWGWRGGRRV